MANTIAVVKRSTLCLLISGVFSNVLSAQSHSLDVDSVAPTTCPTDFHGLRYQQTPVLVFYLPMRFQHH